LNNDSKTFEQQEEELLSELLKRKKARRSLIDFTCYTNPRYEVAALHNLIATKLEAVERGEIKRLMVMCPPRHGKSELCSRRFPAWYMGRHPEHDIISASCDQDLAVDFSRDVREIVRSQECRNVFPAFSLSADSTAVNRWHVAGFDSQGRRAAGGYRAAGIGTNIVGRGANLFIIDDPHKSRAEAESEPNRKEVREWYRSTAYSRLEKNAAIVLILTRWHEEDLAGVLLAQEDEPGGEQWVKIVLPAIDGEGKALWEWKYPRQVLDQTRQVMGEYDWWALYMQSPRPLGGSYFNESMLLKDGKPVEPIDEYGNLGVLDYVVAFMDTALKTGKEHDGLGVVYVGVARHGQVEYPVYVLDWDYKQIEGASLFAWIPTVFTRCEELAQQYRARYGAAPVQIEDKGSGTVLIQQCLNAGLNVQPIDSGLTALGKAERAINVSSYALQGNCKFTPHAYNKTVPFKGRHKNHLLAQILDFRPGSKDTSADDLLDCWSYALSLVIGNYLGF
jgi:hypothetical protein